MFRKGLQDLAGNDDDVLLADLLHAGGLDVLQDHLNEVGLVVRSARRPGRVDQLVVFADRQRAVRREAWSLR